MIAEETYSSEETTLHLARRGFSPLDVMQMMQRLDAELQVDDLCGRRHIDVHDGHLVGRETPWEELEWLKVTRE